MMRDQTVYLTRHGLTYYNALQSLTGPDCYRLRHELKTLDDVASFLKKELSSLDEFFSVIWEKLPHDAHFQVIKDDLSSRGYAQADVFADYLMLFTDPERLAFIRSRSPRTSSTLMKMAHRLGIRLVDGVNAASYDQLNEETAEEHLPPELRAVQQLKTVAQLGQETESFLVEVCDQFYPHDVVVVMHGDKNAALLEHIDKRCRHAPHLTDNCGLWLLNNDGQHLEIEQSTLDSSGLFLLVEEASRERKAARRISEL